MQIVIKDFHSTTTKGTLNEAISFVSQILKMSNGGMLVKNTAKSLQTYKPVNLKFSKH